MAPGASAVAARRAMTDPRRPLAALRLDANRAIDGPFAEVAELVEGVVLRHATTGADGVPRLDALGAARVRLELRRLLDERRGALVVAVATRIAAAERLAETQAERAVRDGRPA
jgi:hypothetical protein